MGHRRGAPDSIKRDSSIYVCLSGPSSSRPKDAVSGACVSGAVRVQGCSPRLIAAAKAGDQMGEQVERLQTNTL